MKREQVSLCVRIERVYVAGTVTQAVAHEVPPEPDGAVRARHHIEIETAHHYNWRDQPKTKNSCGYPVPQIPGVAKHLSVQVTQLVTCNLKQK